MSFINQKNEFEQNKKIYESALLSFKDTDGFDVYNTSIPFEQGGGMYIFGRVERRSEWARSWVRLFERTGEDTYTLVPDSMIYQLEDPYITEVDGQFVLGGTHVRLKQGQIDTYYGYFYKGTDIHDLFYFTTGPDYMKDIRLVQMSGNKIGVFSRPRSEEIRAKYGSESIIGFTTINSLDELRSDVIECAPVIEGLFAKDEWGGCNQCYYLDSGYIGVIGHKCYKEMRDGIELLVYVNIAFVVDPDAQKCLNTKIIATRSCFPDYPAKKSDLTDCVFASGIVMRSDGKADLYSGLGDTAEGRAVIDYPFEGYGKIVSS